MSTREVIAKEQPRHGKPRLTRVSAKGCQLAERRCQRNVGSFRMEPDPTGTPSVTHTAHAPVALPAPLVTAPKGVCSPMILETPKSRVVHEALARLVPDRKEKIMGWITQPYYDKGRVEGKAEGKAEGKLEGEARILSRLLAKRFGLVPDSVRERIFAADVEMIEQWVERSFDAPDLQSVFEAN